MRPCPIWRAKLRFEAQPRAIDPLHGRRAVEAVPRFAQLERCEGIQRIRARPPGRTQKLG